MATKKDDAPKRVDTTGGDDPYPVTQDAPSQDDQTSAVTGDADHEDSPVRTSRPDQPIAGVMAGGVGEHQPTDPEEFDADGRPVGGVEVADNTEQTKAPEAKRENDRAAARETR